MFLRLFLAVLWDGMWPVIVEFSGYTHLLLDPVSFLLFSSRILNHVYRLLNLMKPNHASLMIFFLHKPDHVSSIYFLNKSDYISLIFPFSHTPDPVSVYIDVHKVSCRLPIRIGNRQLTLCTLYIGLFSSLIKPCILYARFFT